MARVMTMLVAVMAVVAIASGCGDSDNSNGDSNADATGSGAVASEESGQGADGDAAAEAGSGGAAIKTSSLDKQTFVKRANAICEKKRKSSIRKVGVYLEKHDTEGLPEAVLISRAFNAGLVPTIEEEMASIRKLGAPEGDEEEIEAILAAQQAAVDEVKELKKVASTEAFEDHFSEAAEQYRAYGLAACAISP